MDNKDFLKTEFVQQILKDVDKAEEDMQQFNILWQKFWDKNEENLGTILICHLSVEHHLNDYLSAANPALKPLDRTRLSFSQKMDIIGDSDKVIQWIRPGLLKLNSIRNKLVHNLETQILDDELVPFRNIVWPWHQAGGKPRNSGILLIKDFALIASGFLAIEAGSIRRYGEGLGLVAYLKWLENALKS
jgi:hypothetical protein